MSFINVAGPIILSGLAELLHTLFYFLLVCLFLEFTSRAICSIVREVYKCKLDLYQSYDENREPASEAPPLHIV